MTIPLEASDIASIQFGVISRAQLLRTGLSERTVGRMRDRGELTQLLPSVYRVAGAPDSWESRLMSAQLWAGPSGAVSHRSAARLLLDLDTDAIEITSATHKRPPNEIVLHYSRLEPRDVTRSGPFRVTKVAKTLATIGAVVPLAVVDELTEKALNKRLVTMQQLRAEHERGHKGSDGKAALHGVLIPRQADPRQLESWLERTLYRQLIASGLPRPVCQHSVSVGPARYRLDLAYPDMKLGIEADGHGSHSSRAQLQRDKARQNALVNEGWRILRFTYWDVVHDVDAVIASVRRALAARP